MDFSEACRLARGGTRRAFVQARVWRWLRGRPGSSSTEIAEALRMTKPAAAHVMQRLKAGGFARYEYIDHRKAARYVRWYAVGDKPPQSRWGTAAGSLDALRANWHRWEDNLRLAGEVLGRPYKRKQAPARKVTDAHPLSQLWIVPISSIDDE